MEQTERYVDKLAKYILAAAGIGIICTICWYFKNVLIYILAAVVVSLIAKPIMGGLQKIRIKGRKAPDWILAAFTLTVVITIILATLTLIVPIISNIVKGISISSIENAAGSIATPLSALNEFLRNTFPQLGSGFRIETVLIEDLHKLFDASAISSMIGSATSFLTNFGIGLFSVVFISFFFIKDDGLFTHIVCSLVPDKHEKNTEKAIDDIGHLLSRYFIGVVIEVIGVALLNFLGLLLIARMGFNASIGIAFMTGILNIIPYVGPLLEEFSAHYCHSSSNTAAPPLWDSM